MKPDSLCYFLKCKLKNPEKLDSSKCRNLFSYYPNYIYMTFDGILLRGKVCLHKFILCGLRKENIARDIIINGDGSR